MTLAFASSFRPFAYLSSKLSFEPSLFQLSQATLLPSLSRPIFPSLSLPLTNDLYILIISFGFISVGVHPYLLSPIARHR